MTEREAKESLEQLREVARELRVSDRQLRRWRDEGLLPKPVQRHGLGRAMGSETFYPSGTCDQLRAVVRWFTYDPRVKRVRWALWCEGFELPHGAIVDALLDGMKKASAEASAQWEAYDRGDPNAIEEFEAREPPALVTLMAEALKSMAGEYEALMPPTVDELSTKLPTALPKPLKVVIERAGAGSAAGWSEGFNLSLQVHDYPALEEYLRTDPSRLAKARDEGVRFFRRWAPERAEREPVPKALVVTTLRWSRLAVPFLKMLEEGLQTPEVREPIEILMKSLLAPDRKASRP